MMFFPSRVVWEAYTRPAGGASGGWGRFQGNRCRVAGRQSPQRKDKHEHGSSLRQKAGAGTQEGRAGRLGTNGHAPSSLAPLEEKRSPRYFHGTTSFK